MRPVGGRAVERVQVAAPALARRAVRAGLLAGAAAVYVAMVGMVEKFAPRNLVGEPVTLGRLLLALPPLVASWAAVAPRVRRGLVEEVGRGQAVAAGTAVGAVAGGVVVAWVALVRLLGVDRVRGIFVAVSPRLLDTLALGRGAVLGSVLLVAGAAVMGAAGAGFRQLPREARRLLAVGLLVTLLLALLQRIVPTLLFELGLDPTWLYSRVTGGLTELGAVVVFAVSTGAAWAWRARRKGLRRAVEEASPQGRRLALGFGLAALLFVVAVLPQLLGSVLSQILGSVAIFLLMALGLNIVVGYAGLLDLGYVAFYAVGAYALALTTGATLVTSLGTQDPVLALRLNFYAAVPLVMAMAAFIGLLIGAPVLRLRGDYLAIVTLGFGEIARVMASSNAARPLVGGAQGIRDVTDAAILGYAFRDPQHFFYLAIGFSLLAAFVSWRLADSRIGRAWSAMREDEQVAEAMGVSTVKYKLLAFAMGGAVGCLSGALVAVQLSTVQPDSFTILVSITALAAVILGGMGSIPGVVVGTLLLIGLPGLLSEFEEFKLLVYGAVLVAVMILRPQGLIPNVRRMRELREEERAQDAWLRARAAAAEAEEEAAAVAGAGEAAPVAGGSGEGQP